MRHILGKPKRTLEIANLLPNRNNVITPSNATPRPLFNRAKATSSELMHPLAGLFTGMVILLADARFVSWDTTAKTLCGLPQFYS